MKMVEKDIVDLEECPEKAYNYAADNGQSFGFVHIVLTKHNRLGMHSQILKWAEAP